MRDSATVGTNTNTFLPALSERSTMASTLSGRRSPLPALLQVSASPRLVLLRSSEAPLAEVFRSKTPRRAFRSKAPWEAFLSKTPSLCHQVTQDQNPPLRQLLHCRPSLQKRWKKIRTRIENLKRLGIEEEQAWMWANTRKGYWRTAHSPILLRVLSNERLKRAGYLGLMECYSAK
jgi:hypothetical protein